MIRGWKNWVCRVASSKRVQWEELGISQCITLSLANLDRHESLLIAASHFWSDALNAFLFGHGPMTPTLADVLMLTGLNVHSPDSPFQILVQTTHKFDTRGAGGWKGFIEKYSKEKGTVDAKEHTAFLLTWLDRFAFCNKSTGPTHMYQPLAEQLSIGAEIPLGKHLLGAVYRLLHQVSKKLLAGSPVSNLGGPWWFINLWLNLHLRKALEQDVFQNQFPSEEREDVENPSRRRCMSFGEAVSQMSGDRKTPSNVTNIFTLFYNGIAPEFLTWYAYEDFDDHFELPISYSLELSNVDPRILTAVLCPGILPAEIFASKERRSYEFYYPSVVARQFLFGQTPIFPFFAEIVQPRNSVPSGLFYDRLKASMIKDPIIDISDWTAASFTTRAFRVWWREFRQHAFNIATSTYCLKIDADFQIPVNEVNSYSSLAPFSF